MSKKNILLKVAVFIILLVLVFIQLSRLFHRKTDSKVAIDSFYNLPENSLDVLFFGSSHMYCTVIPSILYEEFNLDTYLISTDRQPIHASYYWILETLKTQSPSAIVVETYMVNRSEAMLENDEFESVIYTASENMHLNANKGNMLKTLTSYKEDKSPYYVNFLKYHSRWNELTEKDFVYNSNQADAPNRGYVYFEDSEVVERHDFSFDEIEKAEILKTEEIYLNKIIDIANESGIKLIFLSAPYMIGESSASVQLAVSQLAESESIEFYDSNQNFDYYNFDLQSDFFDAGHLNVYGATKFTRIFGGYLSDLFN